MCYSYILRSQSHGYGCMQSNQPHVNHVYTTGLTGIRRHIQTCFLCGCAISESQTNIQDLTIGKWNCKFTTLNYKGNTATQVQPSLPKIHLHSGSERPLEIPCSLVLGNSSNKVSRRNALRRPSSSHSCFDLLPDFKAHTNK